MLNTTFTGRVILIHFELYELNYRNHLVVFLLPALKFIHSKRWVHMKIRLHESLLVLNFSISLYRYGTIWLISKISINSRKFISNALVLKSDMHRKINWKSIHELLPLPAEDLLVVSVCALKKNISYIFHICDIVIFNSLFQQIVLLHSSKYA